MSTITYNSITTLVLLFLFLILSCKTICQYTSDAYWDAILIANNHYGNAEYPEAVSAYQIAWTKENEKEIANHRLKAAAANCMIDNEKGVRENLSKIINVSTKTDMKRVLVNYEIFNKYKQKKWWIDMHKKLDERLAKLIAHHKNLKVFKHGRNVKYRAIRIDKAGDTVANTSILLIPDGTGWGDEAATLQSQVLYQYNYTVQDSTDHIAELDSIVGTRFWIKIDTTGVIENDKKLSIHPFRNNEFFKTEVAPFPEVHFPISNETIQEANSSTVILRNWGLYSPSKTESIYEYLGDEIRNYPFSNPLKCHKFKAIGVNNVHGTSIVEYYFNENFGFTEMYYQIYDDDVIIFKIEEIDY